MARLPHTGGPLGNWGRGPDSGGNVFGGQLGAEALDLMEIGDVTPSVLASPGMRAQLSYLTSRKGGQDAMEQAGIPGSTRRGWKRHAPSAASRERINRAYWGLRATNWKRTGRSMPPTVRQAVAGQLQERAYGKRMTITPIDHRDVQPPAQGAQRLASERELRPSRRGWDSLIGGWSSGDETNLDSAWMNFAGEIDSPPELYYEVSHTGFSL